MTSRFYFLFSKFSVVILLSTFYFLFSGSVFAAEISFDTKTQEIRLDDQFEVGLFLNTEGEDINAIEGKIVFPTEILELKEIKDGNSIINFWIERPSIPKSYILNSKSYLPYSGIIPGGYQEAKGFLFSVVFRAEKEGEGVISFGPSQALLNDGKGTPAKLVIKDLGFRILDLGDLDSKSYILTPPKDIDPPEIFKPEIAQNSEMFDGKWFLVFATQDKKLGIDRYEVLETRYKRQATRKNGWVKAESPYVLKDQKLQSYIYIKAIDRVGNERIAVVAPRYPLRWYEQPLIWGIIILLIAVIVYAIWRKFKNK